MNSEEVLIYLSSCGVNAAIPRADAISAIDFDSLYDLASKHQLTALVAKVLESAGIIDQRFKQEYAKAIRKSLILDSERGIITKKLEEAHIWHVPLKGAVLKEYYPGVGLRQMSDNDILFDSTRADDVRTIMTGLGYAATKYDEGHRDDYQKPPVSHFEMHRMLFTVETSEVFHEYYQNVKECLLKDAGTEYGYHFSNEDFYVYLIAHEFKHFDYGGTGLRSLLDTYVFLKRFQDVLNWKYVERECDKIGIGDFEKKNRALTMTVFSVGHLEGLSKEQAKMLEYFIHSGTYGTWTHVVQNGVKKRGRLNYIWTRAFLPMSAIEEHFPYFYRHKILIPFLPIYRLICRWDNAKREISVIGKVQKGG